MQFPAVGYRLWLLASLFISQIVHSACTINDCEYDIFIEQPGFYVAALDIGHWAYNPDSEQLLYYFWSLSVITDSDRQQGGFNSGLTLKPDSPFQPFIAFYLNQAEAMTLTPTLYTGTATRFSFSLLQQTIDGQRTPILPALAVDNGESIQTPVLQPGFYILAANPTETDNSVQTFGLSVQAQGMVGGVNIGGWMSDQVYSLQGRFAAFYIDVPQRVRFRLIFNDLMQNIGMSHPALQLYQQTENFDFQPYLLKTQTVAVSSNEAEQFGHGPSRNTAISHDGRYVAFASFADNLVAGDTNAAYDVFVKDLATGAIERVSVSSDGTQATPYLIACTAEIPCDGSAMGDTMASFRTACVDSLYPTISGDGRYVSFISAAPLVENDDNHRPDLFVHDRETRTTQRIILTQQRNGQAVATANEQPVYHCLRNTDNFPDVLRNYDPAAMDETGQQLAFATATPLLAEDTNEASDVYWYDRTTEQLQRVSINSAGQQAEPVQVPCHRYLNDAVCSFIPNPDGMASIFPESTQPAMSRDGRWIAFRSRAETLVSDDTNWQADIFVHDRETGLTQRVSVDSQGQQTSRYAIPCAGGSSCIYATPTYRGDSERPQISADGRYVAFSSSATTLVAGYDKRNRSEVYVHDRVTGKTTIVSVDSNGRWSEQQGATSMPPGGSPLIGSHFPQLSADGRYVVFLNTDGSLAPSTNYYEQSYYRDHLMQYLLLHDRTTQQTTLLEPLHNTGFALNFADPSLSQHGNFVAFRVQVDATRFDTSATTQIYLMDIATHIN